MLRLWFSQIQICLIQWELGIFRQLPLTAVISALLASARSVFRTRAALQLEILALRHQVGVLQRSVKRPKLNRFDRLLWAWFCRVWTQWRAASELWSWRRAASSAVPYSAKRAKPTRQLRTERCSPRPPIKVRGHATTTTAFRIVSFRTACRDLLGAKCVQLAIGGHKDTPVDRDGRLETTD
jgi:hypothetical protein